MKKKKVIIIGAEIAGLSALITGALIDGNKKGYRF